MRYTRRSATYIAGLNLAAKVAERLAAFGLIALIAAVFGASTNSDLYFIASILPLTIGTIVGEAMATSVLPPLIRRQGKPTLVPYLAATFWIALGTLVAILAAYLVLISVVVNQTSPTGSTSLLPWLAFSPIIITLGLTSYFTAILLQQERYTWPPFRAAVATISGLLFVGFTLLFTRDVAWIALATSAGYAVALALLFVDTKRAFGLNVFRPPDTESLKEVTELHRNALLSVSGGVVGGQTFVLLERAFAASLGVGAVSTLSYARGIAFTPMIVGQAIAMGTYPGMVRAHEANDPIFVREAAIRGLRLTLLVSAVTVSFFVFFARDVVEVLLQHGALDARDTTAIAHALIAFSPGLVGTMLLILTSRAFYATDLFRGIVLSQLIVAVIYVPLVLVLRDPYGPTGVAAAFGIAELTGGAISCLIAARPLNARWADARVLTTLGRPVLLVIVALAAIRVAVNQTSLSGSTEALVATIVAGASTALIVVLFLLVSDWPEAAVVRHRVRRFCNAFRAERANQGSR